MSPAEHDEAVASISHVPHLAAAALAKATPQQWLSLAASGFKDTTRVAAGDPELWRQIVAENRHHVAQELFKFEQVLAQLRQCVQSADDDLLLELLKEAKQKRDAVGS